jgi:small conductance mechanosensitive channel
MNEVTQQKWERLGYILSNYGWDLILGLIVLVGGLVVARLLSRLLKSGLTRLPIKPAWSATVHQTVTVLLYVVVLGITADLIGLKSANLIKLFIAVALAAAAVIFMFRPYLPSLPFKAGNTIKTGSVLGKVEGTTFLNTRMRTFDGKTVWIPNRLILNDYLINYHYTPTRKIHLDVRIRYDQDLMQAKQVLEALMIEDARVRKTPRPVVFVTQLLPDCVVLGGRCWVENLLYWRARCDLLEKIKLRFDTEGIAFALPQRDVNIRYYGEEDGFEMDEAGLIDAE